LVAHVLPGPVDLILFYCLLKFVALKSPLASVPAGWCKSFDLSGRLPQAMAVRRHGCSMMMVAAVMVAVLHLSKI
jgi:hypothetical protein